MKRRQRQGLSWILTALVIIVVTLIVFSLSERFRTVKLTKDEADFSEAVFRYFVDRYGNTADPAIFLLEFKNGDPPTDFLKRFNDLGRKFEAGSRRPTGGWILIRMSGLEVDLGTEKIIRVGMAFGHDGSVVASIQHRCTVEMRDGRWKVIQVDILGQSIGGGN
jgi:hypothetical protein